MNLRQQITEQIVMAMNQGLPPWRKPWSTSNNSGFPCNFASKRRYHGINPVLLIYSSILGGFGSKFWGTADSWQKHLGVETKPDQKSTNIVLFLFVPKKENKKPVLNSKGENVLCPLMRLFPLFNADQLKVPDVAYLASLPKSKLRKLAKSRGMKVRRGTNSAVIAEMLCHEISERLAKYVGSADRLNTDPDYVPAEALIASTGADIRYGGDRAYYNLGGHIQVPERHRFESIGQFYETVFHELVHWGEHTIGKMKNRTEYAFGELVAEIGACFLMMELKVPMCQKLLLQSQSYIQVWLKHMQSDSKYIFDASRQASRVVDHILSLSKESRVAA